MGFRKECDDVLYLISKNNRDKKLRRDWRRLFAMWCLTVGYVCSVPVLLIIKAIKGFWPIPGLAFNMMYFITFGVLLVFSIMTIVYGVISKRN